VQVTRYKSLNGWVFGNLLLAIWPVIIDLATGNWQRFDEDPILLGLTPGQAPPAYGVQPQVPQPMPQSMPPQAPVPAPQQPPPPAPSAPPPR
jgi:hypothetical protein